jgi:chromosomal replication initiation ATPase DnaA
MRPNIVNQLIKAYEDILKEEMLSFEEMNFVVKNIMKKTKGTPEYVISYIGMLMNVDKDYHIIKSRKTEYVYPRQLAMSIINVFVESNLQKTGNFFNNKDHATVLHAKKTILNYLKYDAYKKAEIMRIVTTLGYDFNLFQEKLRTKIYI